MTRVRISFTFNPRDMLLYLQRDFRFVSAAVACVTLEKASGFEPSYGEMLTFWKTGWMTWGLLSLGTVDLYFQLFRSADERVCGWEEGITILNRLKPVTSGFEFTCIKKIMLCTCLVNKGKIYFWQNYRFSELRNIWDYHQNLIAMMTKLCNQLQLLLQYSFAVYES